MPVRLRLIWFSLCPCKLVYEKTNGIAYGSVTVDYWLVVDIGEWLVVSHRRYAHVYIFGTFAKISGCRIPPRNGLDD